MTFEIVAVLLAAVIIYGYFDRKNLKADAEKAKADVVAAAGKLETSLQVRESQVRNSISTEAKKVVNACYASIDKELAKASAETKAVVARIKAEFTKVELKLKKVV